ncbi:MAG: hypothetical protein JO235_07855 [Chroococcidiopsidaceae cyanobacterium CP_BM_RX_35]|nr:hypothetical protein [Chroococcidiopsidaceae cyanobacterium CP_BM_RX_35]
MTLHWNSQERRAKIVQRWFNPDDGPDGYWFHQLSEDEQFYLEAVLEPRAD